jgi:hypothetical protein
MQLRLLKVNSSELAQFAAQLPVGKIYASGHGFVPQVRTAIFDQLVQFADPAPAPGLPATWDDIDVGHLVHNFWRSAVDTRTERIRALPISSPVPV